MMKATKLMMVVTVWLTYSMMSCTAKPLTRTEITALYPQVNPNGLRPRSVSTRLAERRDCEAANMTLREAAEAIKGRTLRMGAATNANCLANTSDPLYKATVAREYDLITAENACKFGPTEPNMNSYDYKQCSELSAFSQTTSKTFRGHNLCWGQYNPSWLTDKNYTAAELQTFLEDHVRTLITHYNDTIPMWDVVNEAVTGINNSPDIFKPAVPWYPTLKNYVDIAFTAARAAGPSLKLFYNDFGGEGMSNKSNLVYELVSGMQARNIPVDGVGLQMHISVSNYPKFEDVETNMRRLTALGLEVHITELDIQCSDEDEELFALQQQQQPAVCPDKSFCGCDWTHNGTECGTDDGSECHCRCCCPYMKTECKWKPPAKCGSADMLDVQAQVYAGLLQACINVVGCTNFETWGFTDRHTWIKNSKHPLPFDENYNKKPAYFSMLAKLQAAATEPLG
eukprot:m.259583 g.259583  ORF g.259583 m.259583 type:complete len:455 (+) comp38322_c0_seq1:171-1535(+)